MKNDREFLEGIYQKAEVLKREKFQKKFPYKMYIRYSSVAAILVILPLLIFKDQIFELNNEIETPQPRVTRMMERVDYFSQAEYIVIGKTKEISNQKSNEEFVDIVILLENNILGEIEDDEIILRVESHIKEEFKVGDRNLLFLYRQENKYNLLDGSNSQFKELVNDVYVDKYGNQYSLEDIKNNIKGEN